MSLIGNIRAQLEKDLKKVSSSGQDFGSVDMAICEVPKIIEKKGFDYVLFGEDNLYPYKISDLKYGSAIHNAIVSSAADLIAGDGFLINGAKTKEESEANYLALPVDVKLAYDTFLENKGGKNSIAKITKKIAFDLKEQGAYSIEAIYNNDLTKIPIVKYVDVKNIRAGKMVNDEVESYYYSRKWEDSKKANFKPTQIHSFNPEDKEHLNQLVYEKIGGLEYYGEPDFIGALTWIQTDFQMGIFHLSNIENGMNPSMKLQFYKLPSSENDKDIILSNIKKQFTGARKTGKHMVFFSDGKELAPDIEPVQTSNLDKQLLLLAELCDKKILTGHKLTSPLLAGISVSGSLGGNTEIEKAFNIYDKTRIAPYRNMISETYQTILDFNKTPIKIKINPFNPFNG